MQGNGWVLPTLVLVVFVLGGCASQEPTVKQLPEQESRWKVKTAVGVPSSRRIFIQEGIASWYGGNFHGRTSASGEVYDKWQMTAAHKTLPMGTRLVVKHMGNGRTVQVRINDRGPYIKGRIIDLSRAAASQLGMLRQGVARVRLYRIGEPDQPEPRGKYALQIGPFHRLDRARKRVVTFSQRFDPVRMRIDPDGEIIIQMGRFKTQQKAQSRADELHQEGYEPLIIPAEKSTSPPTRANRSNS